MQYFHFIVLVVLVLVTVAIDLKYKVHIYHTIKERLFIVGTFYIVGYLWDYIGVKGGQWVFPRGGTIGPYFAGLPIEEHLFFLVVPYWIIVFYKFLEKGLHKKNSHG